MRFTYTARRELVGGHSLASEYDYVIHGARIDRSRKIVREDTVALDGTRESDFQRFDVLWDVTTDFLETPEALAQFEEFVASVAGGETFVFDPDAVSTADVNPQTVTLESSRLNRRRVGTGDVYTYALQMRVAP